MSAAPTPTTVGSVSQPEALALRPSLPLAEIEGILARLSALEAARGPWLELWRELAGQIMPRKHPALNQAQPGMARAGDEAIYDSTPTHSLELLASALGGLLTNPASAWFDLSLPLSASAEAQAAAPRSDTATVRAFLAECRQRMLQVFNTEATGFQACVHELYLDLCLFGSAVLHVEADEQSIVRFSARPLAEVCLAEDARGVVDTVLRRYSLTARQLWQEWGQAVSPEALQLLENAPDTPVELVSAVYPRAWRNPASPLATDFPYASVTLEAATRHVLEVSGYHEMPYMCPRWAKAPGEAYGRGPGLTALSDVRVLNAMSRTALMAAEKMSDPPLMVPDDGFLGPVHSGPGGLSYYRAGSQDRIEALPVRVDLSAIEAMTERRRQSVRRIFLTDMLAPENATATATEALIRQQEKLRILGPVLGRLQTEFLAPLIERVFNILLRAGELPPWPSELPEGGVKIDYSSPIAQAQRQADAQNLAQAVRYLAPLLQPGDPFHVLDNFQPDAMARHAADLFALPASYLRPQEEVDRLRQARQDRQTAQK